VPISRQERRDYQPPSADDIDAFGQAHSEGADNLADEPPEDWTTGANGELSSALDEEEEI
jgi:hypothetical protein